MLNKKFGFTAFNALLLLFITSCNVLKPVQMPETKEMPVSFPSASVRSLAEVSVREFFPDKNLVSLIDTALKNNPDLLMAHQRIEMAKNELMFRNNAFLPAVGLQTSAGVRKYGNYTMDGVGNFDTNLSGNIGPDRRIPNPVPDYFLGFHSSWEIDIWGKLRNQRKAAYARFLASQKGKQLLTTALVSEVASIYYELIALDAEQEIIQKNIKLQETAVEMITIQKEGGRATELAVKQFAAQLVNTKALSNKIAQEIVTSENQLNFLLGRFPQAIERGDSIQNQTLPEAGTGVPSAMLGRRPDIQMAEYELAAAKADVNAARAAFLPSLTINAHTGLHSFSSALLLNPASLAWGLAAGFLTPVFNQRAVNAAYFMSTASNKTAFINYQKQILNGFSEVVTNLKKIDNYNKIYEYKTQEVEMLHQAVSISNDLYFAGYASYLEVITAQKSVLEAELQQTTAKKEQLIATVELYRALGGGWE
jgi:outer membrane protein, multidrug efflux system